MKKTISFLLLFTSCFIYSMQEIESTVSDLDRPLSNFQDIFRELISQDAILIMDSIKETQNDCNFSQLTHPQSRDEQQYKLPNNYNQKTQVIQNAKDIQKAKEIQRNRYKIQKKLYTLQEGRIREEQQIVGKLDRLLKLNSQQVNRAEELRGLERALERVKLQMLGQHSKRSGISDKARRTKKHKPYFDECSFKISLGSQENFYQPIPLLDREVVDTKKRLNELSCYKQTL